MGLTAEHLKLAQEYFSICLAKLFTYLIQKGHIPNRLKEGILSPAYKKGDPYNPANYRGITLTSVILKVLEHILNACHTPILEPTQSKLQSGFTQGTSSINSALLVTECINEAKSKGDPLTLTTLDAQKAFDVDHNLLLHKLFHDGIQGPEWRILQELYTGVNPLLLNLERKYDGASIGYINLRHTTCADDLALLSHSQYEMQRMLNEVETYSNTERYVINPIKSNVINYNVKQGLSNTCTFGNEKICEPDSVIHLGIKRNKKNTVDTLDKIQLARKTAYSLVGAGLHGKNGVNQSVKAHMWRTFVLPRFLYGLEVLSINKKQMEQLESHQRKTLKQIQHLPDRTSTCAALGLLGVSPVSAIIHRNKLNLFHRILTQKSSIEYEVASRQLAVKDFHDNSWFSEVRRIQHFYKIPSLYSIIVELPKKEHWKETKAINKTVELEWTQQTKEKSSLKYLNSQLLKVNTVHHCYRYVRANVHDAKRAELKARLLTGAYTLQSNRAAFNQYKVDATCKLCRNGVEDRQHFIAECSTFEKQRKKVIALLQNIQRIQDASEVLSNPNYLTHLLLDCTHPTISALCGLDDTEVETVELFSRQYLYGIHTVRCALLQY